MSLARFSDDSFGSDLYIYEGCGGFETHVAENRFEGPIPQLTADVRTSPEEFERQYTRQMRYLESARRIPIENEHAGEIFLDKSAKALRRRVVWLEEQGFRVPERTKRLIEEEVEAEKCSGQAE